MSGQIHRFKKERDFVNLDTHALRNPALSWKAKGLHSYLLQLPDNWQINIADLSNRSKDGRDGTAAGLTELIEAGYVIRQRVLNEKRQFEGWDYNVFEQPKQAEDWKAENGKSVNGFAENGKSVTNKNYTPTELSNELREEEEKNASLSSSTSEPQNFSLEAEKEKPIPPVAPAPPTITVIDPDLPGVTIYDHIPAKQYPTQEPHGEWKRVNIPDELETLKTDAAIREAFSMGRKIPSANFPEYLEAFRLDVIGRGETYANVKQLRAHFLNWSGSRFEIAQRKATQPKPQTNNGQPYKIRQI